MSFTITFQCPLHPTYMAKVAPATSCKACRFMFTVRNAAHKVLSTPRNERRDLEEIIIKGVE